MKKVNVVNKKVRAHRHQRILRRVREGNDRVRIRITKTNSHVYVQAIRDLEQRTIASSSSLALRLKNGNRENCEKLAMDLAKKLKALEVSDLAVDRGGHSYSGRIAVISDILRREGFNL